MSRRFLRILLPAVTGALVLAAWYGFHFWLDQEMRFLLPTPGQILAAFRDNADDLSRAALTTCEGALLGFGCAAVVSFLFAVGLSLSSLVRTSVYPYLMI